MSNNSPSISHKRWYGWIVLILGFFSVPFVFAADSPMPGDVTKDGTVDGRDALQLLREIRGYEPLLQEDQIIGDVFPYPGTGNRKVGDGALTEDDVNRILQQSVGLVSPGEIQGDFTGSPPRILQFGPLFGFVGDEIVIEGENFVVSNPQKNLIFFGDISAEVLSASGTWIVTRVPSDAVSSLIRIQTPGGTALSVGEFRVIHYVQGTMEWKSAPRFDAYTVINEFGASPVGSDGKFTIPVSDRSVSILGFTTESDTDDTLFQIYLPDGNKQEAKSAKHAVSSSPLSVSSLTTAKAMVFLHPFFCTRNAWLADKWMEWMDALPEIRALATVIEQYDGQTEFRLDNPAIQEAWGKAVNALVSALPPAMILPLNDPSSRSSSTNHRSSAGQAVDDPQRWEKEWGMMEKEIDTILDSILHPVNGIAPQAEGITEEPSVRLMGLDRNFTNAEYLPKSAAVKSKTDNGYSPLDWLVTMYRVDPADFPKGINTSFIELRRHDFKRTGYQVYSTVPNCQWTSKIDIFYTSTDYSINQMVDYAFPSFDGMPLQDLSNGLYALRMFSGSFREIAEEYKYDFEAISAMPDGLTLTYLAVGINISLAAVDLWDLITPDSKAAYRQAMKKGIKNVVRKVSQELSRVQPNQLSDKDIVRIVMLSTWEFFKAALTAIPQGVINYYADDMRKSPPQPSTIAVSQEKLIAAQKKFQSTFFSVLESGNKILGVLDKISSAGRFAERVIGLCGYMVNVLDLEYSPGPTPLESILVLVGDPFEAQIHSVKPEQGSEGTVVSIRGKNFARDPEDNEVLFGNIPAKTVHVISSSEIQVAVPRIYVSKYRNFDYFDISLRTAMSSTPAPAPTQFKYYNIPYLTGVSTTKAYSPVPASANSRFAGYEGSLVSVNGYALNDEEWIPFVGVTHATVVTRYADILQIQMPSLAPGQYPLYMMNESTLEKSNEILIDVPGAPTLSRITPSSAQTGEYVKIEGSGFYTVSVWVNDRSATISHFTDTEILFALPRDPQQEEGPASVVVWSPSGSSLPVSLTRVRGIATPNLNIQNLPHGYTCTVNTATSGKTRDGKLSLDEAMSLVSGESTEVLGWDDRNEKITHTWVEKRRIIEWDNQGNPTKYEYYWEEEGARIEELNEPTPPGSAEKRFHYRVNKFFSGEIGDPFLTGEDDLDATVDDKEDADFISGTILSNEYDGNRYQDSIFLSEEGPYRPLSFQLGFRDQIGSSQTAVLDLSQVSSYQIKDGCKLNLGIVQGNRPLILTANAVQIESATFSFSAPSAVKITSGFGNFLGTGVSIRNTGGDGVVVQGGGLNKIAAMISHCGANGVTLEDSVSNEINATLSDCLGSGVWIYRGSNNALKSVSGSSSRMVVDRCNTGITIHSTFDNRVSDCIVQHSEGTGIVLVDTIGNRIESTQCIKNGVNGISFAHAQDDRIYACVIRDNNKAGVEIANRGSGISIAQSVLAGNENGLILSGTDTCRNTISSCHFSEFIDFANNQPQTKGNRINGLIIREGARDNWIYQTNLSDCGEYGLIVEGHATVRNRIGFQSGHYNDGMILSNNTKGGIYLRNGANENTLVFCKILGNPGNGIIVEGNDTRNNSILYCHIGTVRETNGDLFPNEGYGIFLSQAPENQIAYNNLGINKRGGIHIEGLADFLPGNKPGLVLDSNSVGFHQYTDSGDSAFAIRSGTLGNGIELIDTENLFLNNNHVYGHDSGLFIDGERSGHHTIDTISLNGAQRYGCWIRNSKQESIVNMVAVNCGYDGIYLLRVDGVTSTGLASTSQGNGLCGVNIGSSQNVYIASMQIGPQNRGHGVYIAQSENLVLKDCRTFDNLRDGLVATQGSRSIQIVRGDYSQNGGDGFRLEQIRGLTMTGDKPREGLWIMQNQLNGITLRDVVDIHIGSEGKGVNVSNNLGYGILVEGNSTNKVYMESSMVIANGAPQGVRISAGQEIFVGGPASLQRNHIEFHSETGILAEGAETQVSLVNNLVGEPPEWESGNRSNGNRVGIVLDNGIQKARIAGNLINANRDYGIHLRGGARNNTILDNSIYKNGVYGILIEGPNTVENRIGRNSISLNLQEGIRLIDGGNLMVTPPIIDQVTWNGDNVTGSVDAPDGSIVEVFADEEDEGRLWLGMASVLKKRFQTSGFLDPGLEYHATVTYPNGNTSQFGPAYLSGQRYDPIVYTSTDRGNRDIALLIPGQAAPRRLTDDSASDDSPQFSPTGDRILFVSNRGGNPDLWTMDVEGRNPAVFIKNPAPDYDPDWPANSSKVLFVSERDGNPEIYAADIGSAHLYGEIGYSVEPVSTSVSSAAGDGYAVHFTAIPTYLTQIQIYIQSDPARFAWKILPWENGKPGTQPLAEGESTPASVGWISIPLNRIQVPADFVVAIFYLASYQPRLAYSYWSDERSWEYRSSQNLWNPMWGGLFVKVYVEPPPPERLTQNPAKDRHPTMSPDGRKIAYSSDREGKSDIWIMNADGSQSKRLTLGTEINSKPAWSPDGARIAYVSRQNTNSDIYVINADGSNPVRLTSTDSLEDDPVWSRDGRSIVCSSKKDTNCELYAIHVGTSVRKQLTSSMGDSIEPDLGPARIPVLPANALQSVSQMPSSAKRNALQSQDGELAIARGTLSTEGKATLNLFLKSGKKVGNVGFELQYDEGSFLLQNITLPWIDRDEMFAVNPYDFPSGSVPLRFNWIDAAGFSGEGNLVQLEFLARYGIEGGEYPVTLKIPRVYDVNRNELQFDFKNGAIQVDGETTSVQSWMIYE